MKKNDTLEYIDTYASALSFIDSKIPLLEHSDAELNREQKRLNKVKSQFKGWRFPVAWVIFTAICLLPMSIISGAIETELNLLYFTPIVSIVVLYLYKVKYEKKTQQPQINAITSNVKHLEEENKAIIGEINYSKSLADETLTMLMLTEEKKEYDIADVDLIYTNLVFVNYAYGYINEQAITPSMENVLKRYEAIIKELKEKNSSPELLEEYRKGNLRAEYRRGAIKRCMKLSKE